MCINETMKRCRSAYAETNLRLQDSMKTCKQQARLQGKRVAGLRAGMEFVASAEIDTKRQAVLNRHFPHIKQLGAVENVTQEAIGDLVASTGVRRLTPLECERLQGFPDNWTDNQSDKQRYEQLDDSIAIPVAEWICKRIMENAGNNPKSNGNGLPIA